MQKMLSTANSLISKNVFLKISAGLEDTCSAQRAVWCLILLIFHVLDNMETWVCKAELKIYSIVQQCGHLLKIISFSDQHCIKKCNINTQLILMNVVLFWQLFFIVETRVVLFISNVRHVNAKNIAYCVYFIYVIFSTGHMLVSPSVRKGKKEKSHGFCIAEVIWWYLLLP